MSCPMRHLSSIVYNAGPLVVFGTGAFLYHALTQGDALWGLILASCGGSVPLARFALLGAAPAALLFALSASFFLLDILPQCARVRASLRLQLDSPAPDLGTYCGAAFVALQNTLLSLAWAAALVFFVMPWAGLREVPELPSAPVALAQLGVIIAVEEVLFFYSHRLLHLQPFYRLIHARHHTFPAPFGLAAVYAHPLEHLLSNLFPISLGPLLVDAHPLLTLAWTALALCNTVASHSGYAIPGLASPYFHDLHHREPGSCFGVIGLLDALHGTDARLARALEDRDAAGGVAWRRRKSPED